MKKLVSILALMIFALHVMAQEVEVPRNYVLSTTEDYAKYEKDVLAGIDWLLKTPVNQQVEKRREMTAFVLAWISGSPTVSVTINHEIVNFVKKNGSLLMIFMSGWTKYALESHDYTNQVAGNQKGVEAVIDFYTKNKKYLKKDKHVESYIKMRKKGTLSEYIARHV